MRIASRQRSTAPNGAAPNKLPRRTAQQPAAPSRHQSSSSPTVTQSLGVIKLKFTVNLVGCSGQVK
jgi:hypothetical protein